MQQQKIGKKNIFKQLFWLWLAIILVASIIPTFNIMESTSKPESILRFDYLMHFLFFMLLGMLFVLWQHSKKTTKKTVYLWFLLFGIIYGFLTEFAQKYIPGRTFNWNDSFNNVAGIVIGVVAAYIIVEVVKKVQQGS